MQYTQEQVSNFNEQTFAYIITEITDHVLTITLNRPDKRNAFHMPLTCELAYALAYAHYNKDIWVVVLKANGPVFCAGADLKAFSGDNTTEKQITIPFPKEPIKLGDEFNGVYKPVIAQVHASVFAGGFLMICGCTHVIAVDSAQFSLPEVKRGLFPFQVMASLEPIVHGRDLIDLCIRAKPLSASEAQRIGIVSQVVTEDKLVETVNDLVEDIKKQSPTAIRMGLQAYHEMNNYQDNKKHEYLYGMLMKVLASQDAKEGLSAFKEKRQPHWTGN